jgi:ubiquinone biosynthesis monooxygenase Coq7
MVRTSAGSVNAKPCNPATFSPPPRLRGGYFAGLAAMRVYSRLDRVLQGADSLLRAATRTASHQQRATPGAALPDNPLASGPRRRAAGLMRVNHAGEVCAQALYVGQAAWARDDTTRAALLEAAREEGDHLYWCEQRLGELGSYTSRLDPLWFVGSCAIGMVAAASGDRWSLGFVEETERQVVSHLDGHLGRLPDEDLRSRAIVAAMRDDEERHAHDAHVRGAAALPQTIRTMMGWTARVMTTVSYWV